MKGLLEKSRFLHDRLVGRSEAIRELRDRILLIAPTQVTVLVSGESGVGKDVSRPGPASFTARAANARSRC